MDQLSIELIHLVINELHPKDMLECMRVCRSWKKFMETTNPFDTIHVGSRQQLLLLLKKAQADKSLSTQVSNLIFDACFLGDCDVNRIQKYLPHLGAFVCLANDVSVPNLDVVECHSWNQLKYLAISISHVSHMRYFIQDLCPHLTELVLSAPGIVYFTDLMRYLKNTLALTTLAAYGFNFSIIDLEDMLKNLRTGLYHFDKNLAMKSLPLLSHLDLT
jgi:hypothetical protein